MARGKAHMALERRKLALRATILGNRARIATLQEQSKRAKEELKSMSPRRQSSGSVTALPRVNLSR